jgi:ABC-type multidrug transport system ATPase subunit
MTELSSELKTKIQRILGIHGGELENFEPADLIGELCDTVFMLDEGKVISQLTAMREKLTSVNGRIWSLLGHHDPKKARENFNGIAELERYVSELKRRGGKDVPEPHEKAETVAPVDVRQAEDDERVQKLEQQVVEVQEDLQNLFHTLMEVEKLEDEAGLGRQ